MNAAARALLFATCMLAPAAAARATDDLPEGAHPLSARHALIPAFARQYRTGCSTCHTAMPKLNALGEAFRLNGYKMPTNGALLRRMDDPLPLGEEPWKELWPRAIWPGDIPGTSPVAIRANFDGRARRAAIEEGSVTFGFPNDVYVLAGANLSGNIGVFVESEWSREEGFRVLQAKVGFQDPFAWIPKRAFNVWLGQQGLYPFTFADQSIDRAARLRFLWQQFRFAGVALRDNTSGTLRRSESQFSLLNAQQSLEVNGILRRRFYYAAGVAQGPGRTTDDADGAKDVYYRVRYKLGGLALDGAQEAGSAPWTYGGQLLDRSLTLEHFGYTGYETVAPAVLGRHGELGVALRALYGRLDAGAGYVYGAHRDPWGVGAGASYASTFAKTEVMIYPWLIASLKGDVLDVAPGARARAANLDVVAPRTARVMPGLIALTRQNVRLVVEGELFTRHDASAESLRARPHTLWTRLDLAF